MHALRTSTLLSRLVLAWFVLMLGVAGASPLVHPQSMELVCSAGGAVKVMLIDQDGQAAEAGQHTLDCSLCLAPTLPLPPSHVSLPMPQPLALATTPIVAARLAAMVGAPLPPRGPPFFA